MVRKLIKYDFQSFFRLLLPVQLILIGIALINRIVQFFEPVHDMTAASDIYSAIFVSSIVLYVIAIFTCMIMTVIVSIIRFYQGMYSSEGYLNHTLPVTPTQHIFAKLLTSVIFCLGTDLAIFLSFMVITAGDVNVEIFKAIFYLAGKFFGHFGVNGAFYVVEVIVMLLLSQFHLFLKLYFCISIGQLVKRKKILLAFGVYFGIYVIKQIIGTIYSIVMVLDFELIARIGEWVSKHGTTAAHIFFCSYIVITAILALVYFLVSKFIMSKKLNLT